MDITVRIIRFPGGSKKVTFGEGATLRTVLGAMPAPFCEISSVSMQVKPVGESDHISIDSSYVPQNNDSVYLHAKVKGNEGSELVAELVKGLKEALTPPSNWDTEDLIKRYDPQKVAIVDELNRRANGFPCLVLADDGTVDVERTLVMLDHIADGIKTSTEMWVDGKCFPVFRAGEQPVKYADVCPITGDFLVDDYSPKIKRSWAGVKVDARLIVLVHVRYVLHGVPSGTDLDLLVDRIFRDTSETAIATALPEATMLLQEFKANEQPVVGLRKPLPKGRTYAHLKNMGAKQAVPAPSIKISDGDSVTDMIVSVEDDEEF